MPNRFLNRWGYRLPVFLLLQGCAGSASLVNEVSYVRFHDSISQLKAVNKDGKLIPQELNKEATRLCPSGYQEFDVFASEVQGGSSSSSGTAAVTGGVLGGLTGGLLGAGIDALNTDHGVLVIGYIVCNDSGFTTEHANDIVWGRAAAK